MRVARSFRRELDLWVVVWQQVETFLDRIDGARDQDDPHRQKLEALLQAAGVVERQRALQFTASSLSAPVVDAVPTQYWDPGSGSTKSTSEFTGGAWSLDLRKWRVPGTDEVELAVGLLATTGADDDQPKALDQVLLPAERGIFERPREDTGQLELLRLPSYPRGPAGSIAAGAGEPDIEAKPSENADTSSLFSRKQREKATKGEIEEGEPVLAWSVLCQRRRDARNGDDVPQTGLGEPSSTTSGLASQAAGVVAGLRAGTLTSAAARSTLQAVATGARAAATAGNLDADALRAAADMVDQEGSREEGLSDELRRAADFIAGSPEALLALADAADGLRTDVSSVPKREALDDAADALTVAASPPLFTSALEDGLLRADIDDAVGARVGYPDGTLRILRALESGLAAAWVAWLRWFTVRNAAVLEPLASRFRAPFVAGVRALVDGGDTGLSCVGLEVGQDTTVGSDTVITGQPASLRSTLDDLELGQVGVVLGDRPTAVVLLGLDQVSGRLALNVAPLRVSVAPGEPGRPGVLAAGEPIRCDAPGLSAGELQSGEADDGPAADGLVHETVASWSRLCLVFGSELVEAGLKGGASGSAAKTIPDPSTAPLEALVLHGQVPALATTLVITGVGEAYWDRSEDEPQPRIARPGELLLLRGRAEAEDGQAEGPMVQGVVEVDRAYRTTGSILARMDLSAAARLSTTPLELDADRTPVLDCGPEEDVVVVLLRRTSLRQALVADVGLRRDFAGFDLPSLATRRLLPVDFLADVLGRPESDLVGVPGVDRHAEFAAALEVLLEWTRYASND